MQQWRKELIKSSSNGILSQLHHTQQQRNCTFKKGFKQVSIAFSRPLSLVFLSFTSLYDFSLSRFISYVVKLL
jgi:hypothetical protein